jgi:hypothetical protein
MHSHFLRAVFIREAYSKSSKRIKGRPHTRVRPNAVFAELLELRSTGKFNIFKH